ncbi:CGNR zinc finger domain-containing protein [Paludibaculum fermentans]|uniref:CGNR zinc finger domain-containing protein n=1 Tax=Paludibaculum fermentans TaxID=1473598 RepID=UPI003EBC4534
MRLDVTAVMDTGHYTYQFVAGNLALDFVNTVAYRADPGKKIDHLQCAAEVRQWASEAQLPDRAAIHSCPLMGTAALRRIRAVREQLFAVFHAIAIDDPIPADTLAQVGNALHDCCAKRCLALQGADVRWTWRPAARCTDYLLHPVLVAATDLLTSDAHGLVRQCEDAGCGWLFLDRSNARKRRWCSMADCGNRNKARQYYRREAGLL